MVAKPMQKIPLNCPFCDEPSYQKLHSKRLVTPFEIYTLRQCEMGHEFWSMESVPENQDEVAETVVAIRKQRKKERDARYWIEGRGTRAH